MWIPYEYSVKIWSDSHLSISRTRNTIPPIIPRNTSNFPFLRVVLRHRKPTPKKRGSLLLSHVPDSPLGVPQRPSKPGGRFPSFARARLRHRCAKINYHSHHHRVECGGGRICGHKPKKSKRSSRRRNRKGPADRGHTVRAETLQEISISLSISTVAFLEEEVLSPTAD